VSGAPGSGQIEFSVAATSSGADARELFRQAQAASELADAVSLHSIDVPALPGGTVLRFETRLTGGTAGPLRVHWIDPIVMTGQPERPNVLIVMVDTLRADRLSAFGGENSAMPSLDARLDDAVVFSNAYANANWTLPSIATVMTGLFPGQHHAGRRTLLGPSTVETDYEARPISGGIELTIRGQRLRFQMLHPTMTTLGSRFAAAGYYTAAVHENGYLNHPSGVLRGMQYVQEEGSQRADVSTAAAIDWIREHRDEQFFLFFHYIDPHQYILKIDPALMNGSPDAVSAPDRTRILTAYDDLVRETDAQLARFFRAFDALGLNENTYVVFVSDHGEQFFTKGIVGTHGGTFDRGVLHVPLALWGPGVRPRHVEGRVSLADIAPTLVELLALPAPGARYSGDSLVPFLRGRPLPDREILSEYPLWVSPGREEAAALRGDFMLVHRLSGSLDRLYRLPDDETDVAAGNTDTVQAMRERLSRYLEASGAAFERLSYAETAIDPETLRSLRALGYIR
jgi:hypothetical protein